jgi:hypothetical protein
MNIDEKQLLILQTSDSSSIYITQKLFPYDALDLIQLSYSISEGNNPLYWSENWHDDLMKTISIMEFPNRNVSGKRDYISWWLNCRPAYVSETIKPILKTRMETYYSTGEIRNAFRNANQGLEFNCDCLLEWHSILDVQCDGNLLKLIPEENNRRFDDISTITIKFDGFESLPFSMVSLKLELFPDFQRLLDYLYNSLKNEVEQMSYGVDWVLYDSYTGLVLQKSELIDVRPLDAIGIACCESLICYKINGSYD